MQKLSRSSRKSSTTSVVTQNPLHKDKMGVNSRTNSKEKLNTDKNGSSSLFVLPSLPSLNSRNMKRIRERAEAKTASQIELLLSVAKGHTHPIMCILVVKSKMFTGSWDRTIRMWDVQSCQSMGTFRGHWGYIQCLAHMDDVLYSGASDTTIRSWDIMFGAPLRVFKGHKGHIQCIEIVKNDNNNVKLLYSASTDNTIRIWNADNGLTLHILQGHKDSIRHMVIENNLLVSCAKDSLGIWDLQKPTESGTILEGYHQDSIWDIKKVGNTIFTASWDKTLTSFDITTNKVIHVFKGHKGAVNCLEVSDGILYSGSSDCKAMSWNIQTGKRINQFKGHKLSIECIKVVEDVMYTASADSTVRSWNVKIGYSMNVYRGHSGFIPQMTIIEEVLYTVSYDATICLWKAKAEPKQETRIRSRSGGSVIDFYNYSTLSRSSVNTRERTLTEDNTAVPSKYRTRKYSFSSNTNRIKDVTQQHHGSIKRRALSEAGFPQQQRAIFKNEPIQRIKKSYSNLTTSQEKAIEELSNATTYMSRSSIDDIINDVIEEDEREQSSRRTLVTEEEEEEEPVVVYVDYEEYNPFDTIGRSTSSLTVENLNDHSGEEKSVDASETDSVISNPLELPSPTISTSKLLKLIHQLETEQSKGEDDLKKKLEQIVKATTMPLSESISSSSSIEGAVNKKGKLPLKKTPKSISMPDLNFSYQDMQQAIMEAVQSEDADALKFVLSTSAAAAVINDMDYNGMSPLHWAAKLGNGTILKMLLEVKDIDINCRDDVGYTPLHYASHGGHLELVTLLLHHRRINVFLRNSQKQKAIDVCKSKEIIMLLRYAEKKKKLGGGGDKLSSVKVTYNPLFGKGIELNMKSVLDTLQSKDTSLLELRNQIEELQNQSQQLEKDLKTSSGYLFEKPYIKETEDKYY